MHLIHDRVDATVTTPLPSLVTDASHEGITFPPVVHTKSGNGTVPTAFVVDKSNAITA